MKKFLISIFTLFALAVGIFLPTVAGANVTAKADESSALESADTINYVESFLDAGESFTGKWIRIKTGKYFNTTNLRIAYEQSGLKITTLTGGDLDFLNSGVLTKKQFGLLDFFMPTGVTLSLLGTDYDLDAEIWTGVTAPIKLVEPSEPRDVVSGTKLAWTEKDLSVGDTITGKWIRLYGQSWSSMSGQYGFTTESGVYCNYWSDKLYLSAVNGLSYTNIMTESRFNVCDVYIPNDAKFSYSKAGVDGQYETIVLNLCDETVASVNKDYVKVLEAPVVEEPETPGDESSSESVIEPETPGESVIEPETPGESNVESSDGLLQDATDWVNQTLGLSLSVGAFVVICIIAFFAIKK